MSTATLQTYLAHAQLDSMHPHAPGHVVEGLLLQTLDVAHVHRVVLHSIEGTVVTSESVVLQHL